MIASGLVPDQDLNADPGTDPENIFLIRMYPASKIPNLSGYESTVSYWSPCVLCSQCVIEYSECPYLFSHQQLKQNTRYLRCRLFIYPYISWIFPGCGSCPWRTTDDASHRTRAAPPPVVRNRTAAPRQLLLVKTTVAPMAALDGISRALPRPNWRKLWRVSWLSCGKFAPADGWNFRNALHGQETLEHDGTTFLKNFLILIYYSPCYLFENLSLEDDRQDFFTTEFIYLKVYIYEYYTAYS
jgi:hypothetical protein